jgi:hypothetical protein
VGAALDIDNEKDYLAITDRFQEWQQYQRQLIAMHSSRSEKTGS